MPVIAARYSHDALQCPFSSTLCAKHATIRIFSSHPSRTLFPFDKDRAAFAEASSKLQHNQHVLAMTFKKNNRKTTLCSPVCGHFPCSVSLGACITMQ